jgi:pimeloyl-ACP methyl ester carboxylesterase
MSSPLTVHEHFIPNDDGWLLHVRQVISPEHFEPALKPALIVPGYGMNSFIFGFHPRGTSMERGLAESGLEVWSVNMRRQGQSRASRQAPPPPSMRAFAEVDLTALVDGVLARTRSTARRADLIGCSLGGSIAYAHLALRSDHRVGSLVAIGSPLHWKNVPAIFRLAFFSPALVARIPIAGTQPMARAVFPLLQYAPRAVSLYMNPANVDMTAASELTRTVDDPHPMVNADIARWLRIRDLVLRGVNVSEALTDVDIPLLVVAANRDGIVPGSAALSVVERWGGGDVTVLEVGDDTDWYAHADLFIGNNAPALVFEPIARWLRDRN